MTFQNFDTIQNEIPWLSVSQYRTAHHSLSNTNVMAAFFLEIDGFCRHVNLKYIRISREPELYSSTVHIKRDFKGS
jgi:hypothetical protein